MQTFVGTLNLPKAVLQDDVDDDRYERDLVARIRANDRSAAEALVDRTYGAVYASLVKLSGDPDLAADLTQETYRKAWQSFDSFRGGSKLFTWLYRIAYTTFLNVRRRPALVQTVSDERFPDPPSAVPAADEQVIEDESQLQLRRAVLALPDKQRFVISAHYWGELPLPEIARLEGVSAVAIRKRHARALEMLQDVLEKDR